MSDELKKLAGKNFYEALIWLVALLLAIVNYNWLVGFKITYFPNFVMIVFALCFIAAIFYAKSMISNSEVNFIIGIRDTHFILVDMMNAICKATAFSVAIFMFYHRKGEFMSPDFVLQFEFFEIFFLILAYLYVLWFYAHKTR